MPFVLGLIAMTLQILTQPVSEPVSLAEAKAVLRVTDTAEDALISRLISAARQRIEGCHRRRSSQVSTSRVAWGHYLLKGET